MQGKIHYDTTLPMDSSLKMSLRAHALQSIRASAAAGEAGTGLGEDEYDAVRRCASKLDPGLKAPPSFIKFDCEKGYTVLSQLEP